DVRGITRRLPRAALRRGAAPPPRRGPARRRSHTGCRRHRRRRDALAALWRQLRTAARRAREARTHRVPRDVARRQARADRPVAQPYRLQRLVTFLDPWSDPQKFGFQTIQMLYALGLGGPFGEGLGAGKEKFGYLPHPYTDSIFAVLGDELGLAGALVIVLLFLALAFRGVRVALRAEDSTGALLATGITIWLCFQAWVNMAVVASLVPMTGITLPFISYGGSSLCVGLIAVGILLNVGRARTTQRTS